MATHALAMSVLPEAGMQTVSSSFWFFQAEVCRPVQQQQQQQGGQAQCKKQRRGTVGRWERSERVGSSYGTQDLRVQPRD